MDTALGWEQPVRAHRARRMMPFADGHGESAMLNPPVSPARVAVRRAWLDPMRPIPGPGTGPSSFLGRKDWQKPEYAIQYPARSALTQGIWRHSAQIVCKNLSAAPVPVLATSFIQPLGTGAIIRPLRANEGCRHVCAFVLSLRREWSTRDTRPEGVVVLGTASGRSFGQSIAPAPTQHSLRSKYWISPPIDVYSLIAATLYLGR